MSFSRWMVTQTMDTHIYHAIHSATKRNELSRRATTWMNLQGAMSSETKWTPKGYTLYSYIYITFLKWHNFRIGKPIRGCRGLWMGTEGELDAVMEGQHKACLWWNCLVPDMAVDIPIYTWYNSTEHKRVQEKLGASEWDL